MYMVKRRHTVGGGLFRAKRFLPSDRVSSSRLGVELSFEYDTFKSMLGSTWF